MLMEFTILVSASTAWFDHPVSCYFNHDFNHDIYICDSNTAALNQGPLITSKFVDVICILLQKEQAFVHFT